MSGLSEIERQALGLNVDPNAIDIGMTQIDPGEAGSKNEGVSAEALAPYVTQFGQKAIDKAYARGWRPKEEHKGDPANWLDPIDFFDRYAETSDKRAERAAERKVEGIMSTVEKRMQDLGKRVDRIDETDLDATKAYWADMIAAAKPADVPKMLTDRDAAIAKIEAARAPAQTVQADNGPDPAAIEFMNAHPFMTQPRTPDESAFKAWVVARVQQVEAENPALTTAQVFSQMTREIAVRRGDGAQRASGRTLADSGGGNAPAPAATGKMSLADATADMKQAFGMLVRAGAYKENDMQKYLDDYVEANRG